MILIFDTGGGLCNQINDIIYGLQFCLNNQIKFTFRNCRYRNDNLSTFYDVSFNKLFSYESFKECNLFIEYDSIKNNINVNSTYNLITNKIAAFLFNRDLDILTQLLEIKQEYILIKQFWGISRNILLSNTKLLDCILPANHIVDLFKSIRIKLFPNNEPYMFIHYRYENDFTTHFKITIPKLDDILLLLKDKLHDTKYIYIATSNLHLLIDRDNKRYTYIKSKDDTELSHLNYEERAYIDYLFGIESVKVYGHSKSSFSQNLNRIKHTHNYYDLMDSHMTIFTNIYETSRWGSNKDAAYKGSSGGGSSLQRNINYVKFLRSFIQEQSISSVVDLGCGDWRCGSATYDDISIKYIGYDAYDKVIIANASRYPKYTFIHLDFFTHRKDLIKADLCILKDVICHWKNEDIYTFLDYLIANKLYKYILICNGKDQNKDDTDVEVTGNWRPLSANFLPLRKYSPEILLYYDIKEVSVIRL